MFIAPICVHLNFVYLKHSRRWKEGREREGERGGQQERRDGRVTGGEERGEEGTGRGGERRGEDKTRTRGGGRGKGGDRLKEAAR